MPGNKNSGRRDSLPRGGGRPRTRVILTMPRDVMLQLEEIAYQHGAAIEDVVKEALLSFISDAQDERETSE